MKYVTTSGLAVATGVALLGLMSSFVAHAADVDAARASDPTLFGWMVGAPPPADRQIRFDDGTYFSFPQSRWAFSHWREFVPTVEVPRGTGPVSPLVRALRDDLDDVSFVPLGATVAVTWADSLIANYTDGVVVLHRGRIVYERYFGALTAERQHIAFSVTKSFVGTIAAMLISEGSLKPYEKISHYLPELAGSGFGDATVAQVLDMTSAIDFDENYSGQSPTLEAYGYASGFARPPVGYTGPRSIYEYLPTIGKAGSHGTEFHYRTPNVDVVGWLIARVTGKPVTDVLRERIWSLIGAEDQAYLQVDSAGVPLSGAALNVRLRDMARFGEMLRLEGKFNGRQIVPAAVVSKIREGGSRAAFVFGNYATLPGWSYNHFWWVSHDDHGSYMARGIHGQAIYIDPKAEMVIARFASHPMAGNVNIDPMSLPAYRAIADRLMAVPR